MDEIGERMRKAIENIWAKPVFRDDGKEEALLKLQIVSGQDVSAYRSIDTERIDLMTQIIMCSGFDLDEALRLSWYGPWILEKIREDRSEDIGNSMKVFAQSYGVECDHLRIAWNKLSDDIAGELRTCKLYKWLNKKITKGR